MDESVKGEYVERSDAAERELEEGGWGEDQRFGGTGLLWEFSLLRSRDSVRLDWDYL